ncbi:FAD-dependent oxidoreductase, partial [Paenibacillus xylanexedens]|uniref:FAD-dependent oxidoreductase n=1 Tax=Paenibacillus xylanexedens TaxID=528191 RepID=UPI0034D97B3E
MIPQFIYHTPPNNQHPSLKFSHHFPHLPFHLLPFKTPTPPPLHNHTIHFTKTQIQPPHHHPKFFSYQTQSSHNHQFPCSLTY